MDLFNICVPNVNDVKLTIAKNSPVFGRLSISSDYVIFFADKYVCEKLIPHQSIDYIEGKSYQNGTNENHTLNGGQVIIKCKDFRIYNFEIISANGFQKIIQSLSALGKLGHDLQMHHAFVFRPTYQIMENGYEMFKMITEFAKLLATDDWRMTTVNVNYKICSTYSQELIVPAKIDDDTIIASAKFREGGRFPIMCYRHSNGAILCRGAQPLVGQSQRSKYDERLLNTMLSHVKGVIIDTRSHSYASQCKSRGGGYENESCYPQWKRSHNNFDKISSCSLMESLTKLVEACNDHSCSTDKWLARLDNSGWLGYVLNLLNSACIASQCLDKESSSVFVHGSNGFDATLIITSLTQIILNPDCRLIRGFQALIDREWIQAGYPFTLRHMSSCFSYNPQNSKNKQSQPTFLLFLDCVYQLHYQFPTSFEFSTDFLITLFEHSYFSSYGTFLGNCEFDRDTLQIKEKTTSLWSYLNRPEILKNYLNPLYEPNLLNFWPSVAPVSIVLWSELFLRNDRDQKITKKVTDKIHSIIEYDQEIKMSVKKLQKELTDLKKEIDDQKL